MQFDRRQALAIAMLGGSALMPAFGNLAWAAGKPFVPAAGHRSRVLFVNDLCGDLDGLYAAVHMILSPSIALHGIVGTQTGRPGETAQRSVELAQEILALMGRAGKIPVHLGNQARIAEPGVPIRSPGAQAIIDEAMRTDTALPLYVAVGGGLGEVASALMLEPAIAGRFTLIWIGGDSLPGGGTGETNFNIDPLAARHVYNETDLPIWQVPRDVYSDCVVSAAELQAFVAPHGRIGEWLYRQVAEAPARFRNHINMGETWTLGDNPLVLLAALADWAPSSYRPAFRYERFGSSAHDDVIAPLLNADGTFSPRSQGRQIRVYRQIDVRLMLNDLFAKLRVNFPAK